MDRFGQLLIDPPLNPALNMAIDWWLLKTADQPTIRFYKWDQPVISLGYRQQTNPPDELDQLADNFHLIVRPTGGGYLYHHRDLSYSLVLPEEHNLTDRSILESYEAIRGVFGNVLDRLGLLEERGTGSNSTLNENCLDSAADHEPIAEGAKWMAASQLRHRGRLLQHGSLFWRDPNWPEEFTDMEPFHLADPSVDVSPAELRQNLIHDLVDELAPGKTFGIKPRSTSDWDQLLEQTMNFDVPELDQLPVFDRYGTP